MELTIRGEPKEIAALVLEIQERRMPAVKLVIDGKEIGSSIYRLARGQEKPPLETIQKAVQTAIHDKPATN